MRVLHVLDAACARPTDYGRRTHALLAALRAQGVQTVHLSAVAEGDPTGPAPDAWPHHAWHLYRTQAPCAPRWLPRACVGAARMAALALRMRRIARLARPDLIHVHAPSAHAAAAWPVARLARVPLVVEADRRAVAGSRGVRFDRLACARADAVAAPSVEMRAALRAGGIRPRRIAVLPPAADVPAALGPAMHPLDMLDAPLLAYAGNLDAAAGIDLLLAALLDLRRRRRTLRLLIAGGGARTDALQARIAAAGLNGYVRITGPLAGRRAADVLARANVAVFPALAGAGTLAPSRHLLNAMAQGCAVVASDIACHRELLVHGHSGMLFAAGSRNALVDALVPLLDETWRLRPLGRAAAGCVAATHSWTAAATRYRALYESVLADARGPG